MVHLVEMDRNVTLAEQLEDPGGSVILVNKFGIPLQAVWESVDHYQRALADFTPRLQRTWSPHHACSER